MTVAVNGLEATGLKFEQDTLEVSGTPSSAGDYTLTIVFRNDYAAGCYSENGKQVRLYVNPDARSLWKTREPDPRLPYPKSHSDSRREEIQHGVLLGASLRGRSHAHNATYRDDDFSLGVVPDGWIVIAVADGAGSAKYSRQGSDIMCREVMKLIGNETAEHLGLNFERLVEQHRAGPSQQTSQAIKAALRKAMVLPAWHAGKQVEAVAKALDGAELKDYATTLILTVSKKYSFGWFVACFAIGDGGAALLLDPQGIEVRVLNQPEGGEFSGQTRFVTMQEVWDNWESRIHFAIEDRVVALMVMTDGVSDPYFRTDNEFQSPVKWTEFWSILRGAVGLTLDNDQAHEELLSWLEFWVDGEHDDRTLAMLLPD